MTLQKRTSEIHATTRSPSMGPRIIVIQLRRDEAYSFPMTPCQLILKAPAFWTGSPACPWRSGILAG